MHIQKRKNRRFPDITSLRNQQPYGHTESRHFVMRSHDCLKMQGFYSSVQRESVKKTSVLESFKDGDCFCSEFHYFSLDFTRVFCLSLRSFPPRDRQTKNLQYWVSRAVWPSLNSLLCLKIDLKWTIDHGGRRSDVHNL